MNDFPPEDREGSNASAGGVAVLDPIEDLTDLRVVIEDDGVDYARVAPDSSPRDQRKLDSIVALARRLEDLTGWSRNELLDRIGCDHRDTSTLAHDASKLDRCTQFLELMVDAAELVDSEQDHRRVVQSCARLSKATQRDAVGLRRLLASGAPSPLDYVGLGEISTAVRVARTKAGIEPTALDAGPSPYDGTPVVHLSAPRIDLYARDDRAVLGERICASMTAHITTCRPCRSAVEFRRARLQLH